MAHDDEHGFGRSEEIGGVHFDVYEDGHVDIDEQRLLRRIKHKVDVKVGQTVFGCVFMVLFTIIFVGIIGGTAVYIILTVDSSPASVPKTTIWDGAGPFVCKGNDVVEISNVSAKLPTNVAIVAKANCRLTLINVNVEAETALSARGNARVHVQGGSLTGVTAIEALANSQVVTTGTEIAGGKKTSSGASISME